MIEAHILKLPTPRLLAYYKKHYRHNPHEGDGYVADEDAGAYNEFEAERDVLRTELNNREHVE